MNKRNWDFYKTSQRGKEIISLFEKGGDDFEHAIKVLQYANTIGGEEINKYTEDIYYLYEVNISTYSHLLNEWSSESFEDFIDNVVISEFSLDSDSFVFNDENPIIRVDNFRDKINNAQYWSLALYYLSNGAKPILIPRRYDLLKRNSEVLGMNLPDPPRSRDYRESCIFYYTLCDIWNQFQAKYELSDAEFCACLYDYSQTLLDEDICETELPRPTNVWLTGAGKGDFKILDSFFLTKRERLINNQIWACNERTKKGDIIVVYCLSPRSYIHSIWRSQSGGIYNPFDYYHCRTLLSGGKETIHITFEDLKNDIYMSQIPIVRKNLQGINGVNLSPEDYNNLLRMIEEKGGDVSDLPKLYEGEPVEFGKILIERDVEEKILIPMLKRLGYNENDWTRQLMQKFGRNEKGIPDFVFFHHGKKHFEKAPMVIEAKLDMSSPLEYRKAFEQGLSYAQHLEATLMVICDKYRLVLYNVKKLNFNSPEPIFESLWQVIYGDDIVGAKLNSLMGREIVKAMK